MNKLGLRILQIVGSISLFSLIILVLANVLIYNSMFSKLKEDAKNVVTASVESIDADKLEKVILEQSMEIPEYQEVQHSMVLFKNDKDIKFFYTLVKGDNDNTYFAVDSSMVEPSELGEEYDFSSEMQAAFAGEISFTTKPYTDDYGTFISAYAPIKNSAGEVIAISAVDKDVANFVEIRSSSLISTIIVSAALLLLSILMSLLFSKKLSANVRSLTDYLKIMSQGDLTIPLSMNSKDEIQLISESVNDVRIKTGETLRKLRQISDTVIAQINSLSSVSEEMASSSEEVAATIQEVANGTNSQSIEMNKINDIMNGFGAKIDDTLNSILAVNSKVQIINSKAEVTNQDLAVLEEAIKGITLSFADVKKEIKGLSEYLSQIGEVTNLIDSIADQTNLLALNAAIEAARAGESGRGFAVVAEEIRKLAEQSGTSASHINNLLENVITKSNSAIRTSDQTDEKLITQITIVDNSLNSFREIIDNIEEIIPRIDDISTNMKAIDEEKKDIVRSVELTASVAQEVSASSEQITASSQELSASSQDVAVAAQDLSKLSKEINQAILQFRI